MKGNTKAKTMRRIRFFLIVISIFRYGSVILTEGKAPYADIVYNFIEQYLYQGYLGIVLKPICDWFWNWEWYDVIYRFSGIPSLALIVVLTVFIRMKEKGGNIVKSKKYSNFTENVGTYRSPKTSLYFKIKNLIRRKFLADEFSMAKEGDNLVLLRVICGKEERCADMSYESEYIISKTLKAAYDKKEKIIILESANGDRKILQKNDKLVMENMVLQYL